MCGIAGIVEGGGGRPDRCVLDAMVSSLRHRGPDESGVHLDREAALGHARLGILDLVGGRQPMRLPAEDLCLVFNGEIFNYVELRRGMEEEGVPFTTASDTEVLLRLWARRGSRCLGDLNGQWAFAVWDGRARELVLCRDRVGILPLHYALVGGTLIFASEAKAILAHPQVSRALDLRALDQVFTFWHPVGGRTPFEGISQVPPGCLLRFRQGRASIERYWSFAYRPGATAGPPEDLAARLREILVDATRIRLRADVPVGSYLSGGLDSTTVAALVARHTDTPLETFSVAFEDPAYDERVHQRRASEHLGTRHREVCCTAGRIGEVFPDVVWHAEAPVVRTAPAPLFVLSRLVREGGYKVVLTGEGADEVLGGYDVFKEAKVRRFCGRCPESRLRPLLLARLYPYLEGVQRLPPAYLRGFFDAPPEALADPLFSHLPRWRMTSGLARFYSDDVREHLRGYDAFAEMRDSLPADFASWPPFCRAQFLESSGLLPGYILSSQGDRMLMAHSVEGRFPFLDHRLLDFAAGLSVRWKMLGLDEKHLLKRAAKDLLPPEVLARPKQPYRAPDAAAFRPEDGAPEEPAYVEAMLGRRGLERTGLFRPEAVSILRKKAQRGLLSGLRDNMAFVALLSTQLLCHLFVERARPAPTS